MRRKKDVVDVKIVTLGKSWVVQKNSCKFDRVVNEHFFEAFVGFKSVDFLLCLGVQI